MAAKMSAWTAKSGRMPSRLRPPNWEMSQAASSGVPMATGDASVRQRPRPVARPSLGSSPAQVTVQAVQVTRDPR